MDATADLAVIRDPAQAAILLQPERLRLLEALSEPDSASGLARRFALPRQRLNYHLKELEKSGLVQLVEERRKGNCIERVVRATARSYVISPEVLGAIGRTRDESIDRFSAAYLVAAAARVIRDLAGLMARAASSKKRLATLTIETDIRFANAGARAAFGEDLSQAIARLAQKYHDEDAEEGKWFRLVAASYPGSKPQTASPKPQQTRPS